MLFAVWMFPPPSSPSDVTYPNQHQRKLGSLAQGWIEPMYIRQTVRKLVSVLFERPHAPLVVLL